MVNERGNKVVIGPFTVSPHIAAMVNGAPEGNKSALIETILGTFWSDDTDAVQVKILTPTGVLTLGLSMLQAQSVAEQLVRQLEERKV